MSTSGTRSERAAEVLEVMRAEIRKMAESGPTEEELTKAKSYLTASYALSFDTSSKIASALVAIQREDLGIVAGTPIYVVFRMVPFVAPKLTLPQRHLRALKTCKKSRKARCNPAIRVGACAEIAHNGAKPLPDPQISGRPP